MARMRAMVGAVAVVAALGVTAGCSRGEAPASTNLQGALGAQETGQDTGQQDATGTEQEGSLDTGTDSGTSGGTGSSTGSGSGGGTTSSGSTGSLTRQVEATGLQFRLPSTAHEVDTAALGSDPSTLASLQSAGITATDLEMFDFLAFDASGSGAATVVSTRSDTGDMPTAAEYTATLQQGGAALGGLSATPVTTALGQALSVSYTSGAGHYRQLVVSKDGTVNVITITAPTATAASTLLRQITTSVG